MFRLYTETLERLQSRQDSDFLAIIRQLKVTANGLRGTQYQCWCTYALQGSYRSLDPKFIHDFSRLFSQAIFSRCAANIRASLNKIIPKRKKITSKVLVVALTKTLKTFYHLSRLHYHFSDFFLVWKIELLAKISRLFNSSRLCPNPVWH